VLRAAKKSSKFNVVKQIFLINKKRDQIVMVKQLAPTWFGLGYGRKERVFLA
jgi:hypothetical protein